MWYFAKKLPESQFQALWLRYIEEMSIREMGQVMKKTQIYIRVLLHRARLKLSEMVSQKFIPLDESASPSVDGNLFNLAKGE